MMLWTCLLASLPGDEIILLVGHLQDGTAEQKQEAALALSSLAVNHGINHASTQQAIASAGGISPLVELVREGTTSQKQSAALALGFLAADHADNQQAIARAGGIAPLVTLVHEGTTVQKSMAAYALGFLASNHAHNQQAITRAGAISPLVALARDEPQSAQRYAAVSSNTQPPPPRLTQCRLMPSAAQQLHVPFSDRIQIRMLAVRARPTRCQPAREPTGGCASGWPRSSAEARS